MEPLTFKRNDKRLTLGVELELQVLDKESLHLTPKALELLDKLPHPRIVKEFFQSTLEIVTDVCENAKEAEADLRSNLEKVFKVGEEIGVVFASTGTHPMARYADRLITPTERYAELIERNQWLTRRMAVYGLHVHIGVKDGDECVALSNFMLRHLSLFLALSASSPYWQGQDTGLASCRPTTYEALPTAAMPYVYENWEQFQKLYELLIHSESIRGMKDLWWDLRPSPGYGTLEIRVCDGPASLAELTGIVAFMHGMATWFFQQSDEVRAGFSKFPTRWIVRENKWRAMRYGLDARVIVDEEGNLMPIRDQIGLWMERLGPIFDQYGYQEQVAHLEKILREGCSAERQRRVLAETGSLEEVLRSNVRDCMLL